MSTRGARRTSDAPGARVSFPRLTTAAQAAARDHAAITGGTDSFALMQQAASTAAAAIIRHAGNTLAHGVAVFAGRGNNGGDAYLVAAQLARYGVTVRLHAAGVPTTPDAQRAARLAAPFLTFGEITGHERVVVDGILGTGHQGALRDQAAAACARVQLLRDAGARVMALDIPSGVNASTGEVADGAVTADCTIAFGTLKRAHLFGRDRMGLLVLTDIGLGPYAKCPGDEDDGAWRWAAREQLGALLPPLAWDTHKGRRGRVGLVGGDAGMAGAIVLATRAALAAGAGLAHAIVHEASVPALQTLVPQAITHRWPPLLATRKHDVVDPSGDAPRYDAVAVGPGLGRTRESQQLVERLLQVHRGIALVLDADALWLAADAAQALGTDAASLIRHWTRDARAVVCTPHPGEFARLLGRALPDSWDDRAALLAEFSVRSNTTVLLKGTPTLVAHQREPLTAVPYGTPLLATGGSGDCLTGVIATFLAQGVMARDAAVLGAAVHGLAAERATWDALGTVRGLSLDDWRAQLPPVFADLAATPRPDPGELARLAPLSVMRA
ncbi:MAG: NAD(P)H-hydrate dehydratase [Gemmatimonadaceae bacterium]|nr:NAD(P)H-hydrate dehydratase [Gemmatimonadaceae bacterium]